MRIQFNPGIATVVIRITLSTFISVHCANVN